MQNYKYTKEKLKEYGVWLKKCGGGWVTAPPTGKERMVENVDTNFIQILLLNRAPRSVQSLPPEGKGNVWDGQYLINAAYDNHTRSPLHTAYV